MENKEEKELIKLINEKKRYLRYVRSRNKNCAISKSDIYEELAVEQEIEELENKLKEI